MRSVRQGDVLIKQVRNRSMKGRDLREAGRVILAHGEVTGHCHEVMGATETALPPASFFEDPESGKRYLFVQAPCRVVHPEHGAIALAPGCFEVIRQREYEPEGIRTVAD